MFTTALTAERRWNLVIWTEHFAENLFAPICLPTSEFAKIWKFTHQLQTSYFPSFPVDLHMTVNCSVIKLAVGIPQSLFNSNASASIMKVHSCWAIHQQLTRLSTKDVNSIHVVSICCLWHAFRQTYNLAWVSFWIIICIVGFNRAVCVKCML